MPARYGDENTFTFRWLRTSPGTLDASNVNRVDNLAGPLSFAVNLLYRERAHSRKPCSRKSL